MPDEKDYNLTVFVIDPTDPNQYDNSLSVYYNKYYRQTSHIFNVTSVGTDLYNVSIFVKNEKNCSRDNLSVYAFIPDDFNVTVNGTTPNSSIHTVTGTVYSWKYAYSGWENRSFYYTAEGLSDYKLSGLYQTGK